MYSIFMVSINSIRPTLCNQAGNILYFIKKLTKTYGKLFSIMGAMREIDFRIHLVKVSKSLVMVYQRHRIGRNLLRILFFLFWSLILA
jgi:hypothetical protein